MAGVCSTAGCPDFATYRGRCSTHASQVNQHQHRTVPTKVARTSTERKRRAAAVAAHRAQHGDWCPGYQRDGHPATDLTADDVVPVSRTGQPSAELAVLCRSCNSRKGGHRAASE
jgi:5-methylcytosine-specific restriction protein A